MRCPLLLSLSLLLSACVSPPDGIEPVTGFELERYLGSWYEIARLDHRFERNLQSVSAQYELLDDGSVKVINRGFNVVKNEWQDVEGKGRLAGESDEGFLKVSFFGPFYGAYVVFALDAEYRHAFVAGDSRDNLWLLARRPEVSEQVKQAFLEAAKSRGFDTDELIWVDHSRGQ